MLKQIPEPVKKRVQRKDQREKYLNEWKNLFESIHPEITVVIENNIISSRVREITNDISLGHSWRDYRILVVLPQELELEYLIGLAYDKMFSAREINLDTFAQENHGYDYEPEVKKWKDFYYELCNISDRNTKQFPRPVK